MNVLLISTYELGRQPFGVASPAAWLRRAGASVSCLDLSCESLAEEPVRSADLIAFYVPMHTATRLATQFLPSVRQINPGAHVCFYGLYAPVNEAFLRKLGAETILGGEFEAGLVQALERLRASQGPARPGGQATTQTEPVISLGKQKFLVPDRAGLPPLRRYAHLVVPGTPAEAGRPHRTVGTTEASRGCKHLCRHCPIVPVYGGQFRIVQPEVVLEDIRRQVAAGAEHITFGDPDFFNGIRHAVGIVTALHQEFPELSYDVTTKIEHLLRHAEHLRTLRDTGCLFVTSAVESFDDPVLARLDKGHTFEDFAAVVELFREVGLTLSPTFVAFTPWTTLESYLQFLATVAGLGLIENVAPIQLAIRLLIPAGSRLLELREIRETVGEFNEAALVFPWPHADPRVDELCGRAQAAIQGAEKAGAGRREIFRRVWALTHEIEGLAAAEISEPETVARAAIPYLTEPWYC